MIDYSDALNLSTLIHAQDPTLNIGYLDVTYSDLGGADRASLMIRATSETKQKFPYGILQNAHYSMFQVDYNHQKNRYVIEQFSKHHEMPKFRKCSTAKSLTEVAQKIVNYFN